MKGWRNMAKKNNIARNIAIGVAAGVAVSMLKKENREKVKIQQKKQNKDDWNWWKCKDQRKSANCYR